MHDRLTEALRGGDGSALDQLSGCRPIDRRDGLLSLATIHDLHLAPIDEVGDAVRFQHRPAVASLKLHLEDVFLGELARRDGLERWRLPGDAVAAMRAIAARDQIPAIYRWLADDASADEMRSFLALEGGPDGGFDDLVAICQVGLDGEAKLELGRNYWDEMGRGSLEDVHTELYRRFVQAIDLPLVPRAAQPVEALERSLLSSLLATNRRFHAEMLGALGLIELQAGPRCRRVLAAFERVGFAGDVRRFYDEHAVADPRHGKDWLDHVVATLSSDVWAAGMVRGARWRWLVNDAFFTAMAERYMPTNDARAGVDEQTRESSAA